MQNEVKPKPKCAYSANFTTFEDGSVNGVVYKYDAEGNEEEILHKSFHSLNSALMNSQIVILKNDNK